MKLRLLLCLLLLAVTGCRGPFAARRLILDPAVDKVRLFSEALAARDAGDLATARARLQELQEVAPNDAEVRRLLAGVERSLAAPPPPPPVSRAEPPAPVAALPNLPPGAPGPAALPGQMPVVIEEARADAAPPVPLDPRTQALVRVEATGAALAQLPEEARTERLMEYIQAQQRLAGEYAREGNFTAAMRTIDSALASIDISIAELREERARYYEGEIRSREGIRPRLRR
jgi:tetratricopeptide (TPR) repeat protein